MSEQSVRNDGVSNSWDGMAALGSNRVGPERENTSLLLPDTVSLSVWSQDDGGLVVSLDVRLYVLQTVVQISEQGIIYSVGLSSQIAWKQLNDVIGILLKFHEMSLSSRDISNY